MEVPGDFLQVSKCDAHLQEGPETGSGELQAPGRGLTSLMSFYDKVTSLVDEGKALDAMYLEFSVLDGIRSTVGNGTRTMVILLYLALVRLHLESCVQFWITHNKKDIEVLECVPRATEQVEFGAYKSPLSDSTSL
ncbi:hypothetical protein HGM15179_002477 [Zosterops borbonicus]|uniref:Uncharacterized protein n=1 Tax=Zosterops borbonicus TaxID=364589 RepID=A0A8K1LSG1_9PASS|nr:hypothetical protein HGM15179_002477 [Zosterops borbonicus]